MTKVVANFLFRPMLDGSSTWSSENLPADAIAVVGTHLAGCLLEKRVVVVESEREDEGGAILCRVRGEPVVLGIDFEFEAFSKRAKVGIQVVAIDFLSSLNPIRRRRVLRVAKEFSEMFMHILNEEQIRGNLAELFEVDSDAHMNQWLGFE